MEVSMTSFFVPEMVYHNGRDLIEEVLNRTRPSDSVIIEFFHTLIKGVSANTRLTITQAKLLEDKLVQVICNDFCKVLEDPCSNTQFALLIIRFVHGAHLANRPFF